MKARFIAFYLPQFHPIPENDEWWGKGFTEWTNVAKAKPLFRSHVQPRIPTELGFYDLRLPEVREAQAQLAKEGGIEGFCYWHYWFGNGKQLLERPINEVIRSGKPDFPFCLGWANHTWTSRTWNKNKSDNPDILIEQTYPGVQDHIDHFYSVLPALKDKRYITVDGKPLFLVYMPLDVPDISDMIKLWNKLAVENNLKGIHFVSMVFSASFRNQLSGAKNIKGFINRYKVKNCADYYRRILDLGFDALCSDGKIRGEILYHGFFAAVILTFLQKIGIVRYLKYKQSRINKNLFISEDKWENVYPNVVPNWDRTPRAKNTSIYVQSTPQVFEDSVLNALDIVKDKDEEHRIIFIKSWNEWGEGNYMEPDLQYGKGYLNALKNAINKFK